MKIIQSGEASRWRVCYQRGLPRLVYICVYNFARINLFFRYFAKFTFLDIQPQSRLAFGHHHRVSWPSSLRPSAITILQYAQPWTRMLGVYQRRGVWSGMRKIITFYIFYIKLPPMGRKLKKLIEMEETGKKWNKH